jgi:hypothetical protein
VSGIEPDEDIPQNLEIYAGMLLLKVFYSLIENPVRHGGSLTNWAFGKNTGLGLFLVLEILSITKIAITETGKEGEGSRFETALHGGGYRFEKK